MLPFIKPAHVKRFYDEDEIKTYNDAIRVAVENMNINPSERNLLVTHQFVTGATRCESEEISIGGIDNVDGSVFESFDYVALGHIHSPQCTGRETVRYCGTPLKYSFSEATQQKSVTIFTIQEKGSISIREIPLLPMRDMHEIRGRYEDLAGKSFYEGTTYQDDYMHITLTDEDDIFDAIGKLRSIYHNIMKLDYDNTRTRNNFKITGSDSIEQKSPVDLMGELFEKQNGRPMTEEQELFVSNLIEEIWGDFA
jgi:exonuclease SbcD